MCRMTLLLLFFLAACADPEPSMEQRIRELIGQGEQAAEARSRGFFADTVADDYQDEAGRSRRDLLRLLTGYFLRNQTIHLLVRTHEIRIEGPKHATAVVYAGMAGSPMEGFDQLMTLRAAVYRLELRFVQGDEPRLVEAKWRRLQPGELIP